MKKILASLLLPVALLLTASAQTNKQPLVVVISLDGLPARALNDPMLPMPTLRALVANGAVSSGMRPINPTVTWPNHTTLVTGVDASKHHVMANGLIELPADGGSPQIEPDANKDKLVHAETLYEAASAKGMTVGQVDWVAIHNAHGVAWQFEENPNPKSPIAQDLVREGILTEDTLEHFGQHSNPAWHDEIWTDAAIDILEHHTPNLLLLHLLQTDSVQHVYGPMNSAAYATYAYADSRIALVVDAVRRIGALDRTTFFIVSDHGFAGFTHSIHLNAGLVEQGILHRDGNHVFGPVQIKSEGGAAQVFIRDAKLIPQVKTYFAALPGIAHVYTNAEAQALGIPAEKDTDQAPQLFLTAAADYAFDDDPNEPIVTTHSLEGQHGYLNTEPDMQALFVASGAHIQPGLKLGPITNLRVAPTIAKVLGINLPAAQERPLIEILR